MEADWAEQHQHHGGMSRQAHIHECTCAASLWKIQFNASPEIDFLSAFPGIVACIHVYLHLSFLFNIHSSNIFVKHL
jgi:hypothetical protein